MINTISIAACLLTMVGSYLVAQGRLRPAYVLGVITGLLYTILNAAIALADRSQFGVMLLIIPSVWGIAMSVVGLRRMNAQGGNL